MNQNISAKDKSAVVADISRRKLSDLPTKYLKKEDDYEVVDPEEEKE